MPVTSPGSTTGRLLSADMLRPAIDPPRTPVAERAARIRFRRALSLMAMTLVAPGSAQLAAGNRRVGRIALRLWLVLLVVGAVSLLVLALDPHVGLSLAVAPRFLLALKVALADRGSAPTLVFDEVDTGIGGRLLCRCDGERTWLEVYEPVPRREAFLAVLKMGTDSE